VDTGQLPVRVISSHEPHHIDAHGNVMCWCDQKYPCPSKQKAALAQLGTMAAMTTAATIEYLRLVTKPRLAGMAENLRHQLFDWIPAAVDQQRRIERAWQVASTGAQRAVNNIATFAQRMRESRLTPGSGLRPVNGRRGVVGYGEVRDKSPARR
jgi:hypothetical protein